MMNGWVKLPDGSFINLEHAVSVIEKESEGELLVVIEFLLPKGKSNPFVCKYFYEDNALFILREMESRFYNSQSSTE